MGCRQLPGIADAGGRGVGLLKNCFFFGRQCHRLHEPTRSTCGARHPGTKSPQRKREDEVAVMLRFQETLAPPKTDHGLDANKASSMLSSEFAFSSLG